MKYRIILEETSTGFSAWSPDVDGCIATGTTREESEKNMQEAIGFHLEGLREEGYEIPTSHTLPAYVEVTLS